jgi:hypothetical protein
VFRTADGVSGVGGHGLVGDKPVKEHADGGEVLLDSRLGMALLEQLDVCRHCDGLDVLERAEAFLFAPLEEGDGVAVVGAAGMRIADVGGEVFDEAGDGVLTG